MKPLNYPNRVRIGVPHLPWPVLLHREESVRGKTSLDMELGIVEEENPERQLKLSTSLSAQQVYGEYYRNMPVPGQLEAFEKILERNGRDKTHKAVYLRGDP